MLRKLFLTGLTLVIVARGAECLATSAELCARVARSQEQPPLEDPRDGDPNESGCLCRGALVHVVCPVAALTKDSQVWAQFVASDTSHALVLAQPQTSYPESSWPPPPRAGTLRALLAVWRI